MIEQLKAGWELAMVVWAIEGARLPLGALALAGVAAVLLRPGRVNFNTNNASSFESFDFEIKRPTNTSWLKRQWWNLKPPTDLMVIDGLKIDRTRKPHCKWVGPTGSGKSQSLATVRCDKKRPMLIVTPDLSDPFIPIADFRWTAGQGPSPINLLIGSPADVAERLTEVFRSGGNGVWKMTARRATTSVIQVLDANGEQRTLQRIGELLQEATAGNREIKMACGGWVERFLATAMQFGPSIGEGGADIADLLARGYTVLLDNDAFDHPALGADVVAFGLAEAKRCAALLPGGFRLVFEEAGQLEDRIDLADGFFRAGRRRKIAVDVLTQAESDLDEAIMSNTATSIYFGQELKSLQKAAADRLGLDYRDLDVGRMKDFTAWIAHGKIRRLVKFPKPKKVVPRPVSVADAVQETERIHKNGYGKRIEVIELSREALPMLNPPSEKMSELQEGGYLEGGCLRWRGSHLKDKQGRQTYGRVHIPSVGWEYVHIVAWEHAYGPIPKMLNEKTGRLERVDTIDHLSRVCKYKDCHLLTHLERVTRDENSKRRWRIHGKGGAGGKGWEASVSQK